MYYTSFRIIILKYLTLLQRKTKKRKDKIESSVMLSQEDYTWSLCVSKFKSNTKFCTVYKIQVFAFSLTYYFFSLRYVYLNLFSQGANYKVSNIWNTRKMGQFVSISMGKKENYAILIASNSPLFSRKIKRYFYELYWRNSK